MSSSLFDCPLCHEKYDNIKNIPKVIAKCGSTICLQCLQKIFKGKKEYHKCPLHPELNEPLLATQPSQFAPNLILLQSLKEYNIKPSTCPEHKSKLKYVCLNDEMLLCKHCLESRDHVTHDVSHLNDFKDQVFTKKHELKAVLSQLKDPISPHQENMIQSLKEKVDGLKKFLAEKQSQLLNEMNKQILQEKSELEKEKLTLEKNIKTKIAHLNQNNYNQDFFEALNGDFSENSSLQNQALNSRKEIAVVQTGKISALTKGVLDAFHSLEKNLSSHDQCSQEVEEDGFLYLPYRGNKYGILIQPHDHYTAFIPVFRSSKRSLWPEELEELIKTLKPLSSSQKLLIDFSNLKPNFSYVELILELWEDFNTFIEIALDLSNPDLTDEDFLQFLDHFLGDQTDGKTKSFDINLSGCTLLSSSLNKLPDFISNLVKLRKLLVDLSGTNANNQTVDAFMNSGITSIRSLDFLSLNFSFSLVNEEGVNTLFKSLSSLTGQLKVLEIDIRQVNSPTEKMRYYSLDEFRKMKSMRVVILILAGFKLLENITENLFIKYPKRIINIEHFILDLSETKGADSFTSKLNLMTDFPLTNCGLKSLHLEMAESDITPHFFQSIFNKPAFASSLKSLDINITSTSIGDDFLETFTNNFLPNMEKIENLTFQVTYSNITADQLEKLRKELALRSEGTLPDLKEFDVGYVLEKVEIEQKEDVNAIQQYPRLSSQPKKKKKKEKAQQNTKKSQKFKKPPAPWHIFL